MTCNSKLPKKERFSPQDYMTKNASNEILLNMKVVDISLPFPKCPRTSTLKDLKSGQNFPKIESDL